MVLLVGIPTMCLLVTKVSLKTRGHINDRHQMSLVYQQGDYRVLGYHGCRQAEETVVMRGLHWNQSINVQRKLVQSYLTRLTTIILNH